MQPSPLQAAEMTRWAILPDAVLSEVRTLPRAAVLHVWRVLRLLALRVDPRSPAPPQFDKRGMEALEEAILRADYDEAIRFPLAVVTRCLTPGVDVEPGRLAWACLCAAEWMVSAEEAPGTCRSFVFAAAHVSGLASYMALARRISAGASLKTNEADEPGD